MFREKKLESTGSKYPIIIQPTTGIDEEIAIRKQLHEQALAKYNSALRASTAPNVDRWTRVLQQIERDKLLKTVEHLEYKRERLEELEATSSLSVRSQRRSKKRKEHN